MRCTVDRDLSLLHALEQRGLGLRAGAVDLVDQHQVREDGAGPELELVRLQVVDVDAGDVRGEQVGGRLDPRELTVERPRERLRQHRLPDAGEVLEDDVALAEHGQHAPLQQLLRRVDHPGDVLDHTPGRLAGSRDGLRGRRVVQFVCFHRNVLSSDRRTLLYGGTRRPVRDPVQDGGRAGLLGAARYQRLIV